MRVVGDLLELAAPARIPGCYLDRHHLCWTTGDGLGGYAVWGRPDAHDAARFVRTLEIALDRPDLHPPALVSDFRALEWADADAFQVVRAHIERNASRIAALGTREAVLRPEGVLGSAVAGFYEVATVPSRRRVFVDAAEVAAWLGDPRVLPLLDEVETIRAARVAPLAPLDRLRGLLDRDPSIATVEAAARVLAMSPRSLQRQLAGAATRFRDELRAARLRRAKTLLDGDRKLAAIAAEVGFASPQHFATWFRRQTGCSPRAWRDRQ